MERALNLQSIGGNGHVEALFGVHVAGLRGGGGGANLLSLHAMAPGAWVSV